MLFGVIYVIGVGLMIWDVFARYEDFSVGGPDPRYEFVIGEV